MINYNILQNKTNINIFIKYPTIKFSKQLRILQQMGYCTITPSEET